MRESFTLAEVIVILVILAILTAMAVPLYMKASERALNREAQAMLELIVQAEKVYRLELTGYVNCSNASDCNSELFLNLPTSSSNWRYNVTGAGVNVFSAVALRNGSDNRTWTIIHNRTANPTETGPTCAGSAAFCN